MSLKYLLSAVLLTISVTAQYGSGSGGWGGGGSGWSSSSIAGAVPTASAITASSSGLPSGELIVQIVSVSDTNGSLKYFPESVQAPIGSIVQFQYHPKNHTVTESSFAEPCKAVAANLSTPVRPGLKSGFVPVTGLEATTPVYNVLINDTKPIWIYCGQVNHCAKGMSMVINQNLSDSVHTLQNYQIAAAQIPLIVPNTTVTTSSSAATIPPPVAATSVGNTSSAFSSVVISAATSTSTTAAGTTTATASATTSSIAPATFTGVATKPRIYGPSGILGLLFAGLGALL